MALYQAQNLDVVTLATGGIDGSQTTLPLATGHGARLASTASSAGSYPLTIWNSSQYHNPHEDPNVEIVLVTSHDGSSDTIATITRGTEGTSAVAHNSSGVTYKAVAGFTKVLYDDLKDNLCRCQILPSAYQTLWGSLVLGASYTNLGVYVLPVQLTRHDNAKYISFHCSTAFPAGDKACVGLYDSAKNLVLDGGFQGLDVTATNLVSTLSPTVSFKSGMYYLAWSVSKTTNAKALWGISFDTGNAGIVNMGGTAVHCGLAANSASNAAIGSQGLPATLGTISAVAFTLGFPVTIISSDQA